MMVIEPIDKLPRHSDAFLYVNDLIIDLKLVLAGQKPISEITHERLEEWTKKHAHNIKDCCERAKLRY